MAKAKSRAKKGRRSRKRTASRGILADLLAPVAAILVLGCAMVRVTIDRAAHRAGAGAAAYRPPGAAIEEKKREATTKGGLRARLEQAGRRIPPLGRALEVQQRYSELRGNNVAAAVTFQAFVSLLPLLLVIVSVVGLVAANSDVDVAGRIIGNLGLTGDAAETIRNAVRSARDSHSVVGPIGLLGLLWTGLGLVNALQYAMNQVWQVEERGLKDKAVGVGWLLGAVVIFVGASAVTTVLRWLPGALAPLGIAVGLGVNFLLWLWTFRVLPNSDVGWKPLVPGAIAGAIGMEVLKVAGGIYVPRAVANSSELYGTLGVVFAVLAWLLFFGRLILYSSVLNVVLHEKRAGTVRTVIDVPAQGGVQPSDDVTRSGRVERADIKA